MSEGSRKESGRERRYNLATLSRKGGYLYVVALDDGVDVADDGRLDTGSGLDRHRRRHCGSVAASQEIGRCHIIAWYGFTVPGYFH